MNLIGKNVFLKKTFDFFQKYNEFNEFGSYAITPVDSRVHTIGSKVFWRYAGKRSPLPIAFG